MTNLITMNNTRSGGIEFENLKATELRLGMPGTEDDEPIARAQKRTLELSETDSSEYDQPMAKAQIVGWPPVRNYRRNSFQARTCEAEGNGIFVKVRMDGAAYLRKVDLKMYKGYKELREALENMFKDITLEHTIAYEDKDGDWMLVGDVPWSMFVSTCKRLRIMKGSEARGLNINR